MKKEDIIFKEVVSSFRGYKAIHPEKEEDLKDMLRNLIYFRNMFRDGEIQFYDFFKNAYSALLYVDIDNVSKLI